MKKIKKTNISFIKLLNKVSIHRKDWKFHKKISPMINLQNEMKTEVDTSLNYMQ